MFLANGGAMAPETTPDKLKECSMIGPDDKRVLFLISLGENHKEKCNFKEFAVEDVRSRIYYTITQGQYSSVVI